MGDRLRKWRLDRSLLQSEIAERLGVDQSTITNWELNRTADSTAPQSSRSPAVVANLPESRLVELARLCMKEMEAVLLHPPSRQARPEG